jgi:hypothetical protein
MATTLDIEEMRQTLRKVSIYRQVCEQVRSGAGHTLFNGIFFLGLAVLYYNLLGKFHFLLIGPLVIGTLEILVGLWKRIRPSPECVLFDAILQVTFVGWIVLRELLTMQNNANAKPSLMTVGIGLWIAYDAFNTFQHYLKLRRLFVERPTGEHLAYVDDLTAEVAEGNPESDPTIIEVPTRPFLKAKLLGDVAFFFDDSSRELFLCARNEMEITRLSRDGDLKYGLRILREDYPLCQLGSTSWNNYATWKSAGGQPPAPVTVSRDR